MRYRLAIAFVLLVALSLFSIAVAAQHPEHHPAQTAPKAESRADKSAAMMAHHQEIQTIVGQVIQNFTALEQEKDPEVLKNKMAEYHVLLGQLQSKMKQCSEMVADMDQHMKTCPMKRPEKKQD